MWYVNKMNHKSYSDCNRIGKFLILNTQNYSAWFGLNVLDCLAFIIEEWSFINALFVHLKLVSKWTRCLTTLPVYKDWFTFLILLVFDSKSLWSPTLGHLYRIEYNFWWNETGDFVKASYDD